MSPRCGQLTQYAYLDVWPDDLAHAFSRRLGPSGDESDDTADSRGGDSAIRLLVTREPRVLAVEGILIIATAPRDSAFAADTDTDAMHV